MDYSTATAPALVSPALLDMCAIKDRDPDLLPELKTATVQIYADMLHVKRHFPTKRDRDRHHHNSSSAGNQSDDTESPAGGTRREISSFSRRSRTNMFRLLAKLRNVDVGAFITLTYPGAWHGDWKRSKRDLKVFKQRLERKFPDAGYIWRLEIKRRLSGDSEGQLAPHYHLLLFGVDIRSELKKRDLEKWLCESWHEVVAYGGDEHLRHGANVSEIRCRAQARLYIAKYAAKADEPISERYSTKVLCGRRWGIGGKLDVAIAVAFELSHDQAIELRRLIVRWMKSRGCRYARRLARSNETVGWTAFGLGDISNDAWTSLFESTVFRMIVQL